MRRLDFLFVLLIVGCGSGTYPVQGIVMYDDGKPATQLAGGFVSFQSVEGGVSAQGDIQRDGSFTLSMFKQGDGALPGKYTVMVTPPPFSGSETQRAPVLIDPAFSDPKRPLIEVTVEAQRNDLTLNVRRAKQKAK